MEVLNKISKYKYEMIKEKTIIFSSFKVHQVRERFRTEKGRRGFTKTLKELSLEHVEETALRRIHRCKYFTLLHQLLIN